ncbi:unnamed protein product [Urochloa decumbens]|uniref:Ripening-related protein 2 n=1 Tax=Urochloa decumbens TaxID=240449 RepID=A0ABC8Y0E7_9POAL
MVDIRVLVVFALLQIMSFPFHEVSAATCHASGFIHGKGRNCNREIGFGPLLCRRQALSAVQMLASDPVSTKTPAILTFNRFENGEDDTRITSCDNRFHSDKELLVILSSGWLKHNGTSCCNKKIRVHANARSVLAKVVDECDSAHGCDEEHAFEPPCRNDVLNASPAVWKALRLNESIGEF